MSRGLGDVYKRQGLASMHHISDQHSVPSHCPLQSPGKQSVHNNDSCQETLPKPFTCTAISVQSRAVQSSTPGWHSEHTITMQTQCLSNLLTGHRMAMTQQNLVCTQLSSTGTETETGMGGSLHVFHSVRVCVWLWLCVCVCACVALCVLQRNQTRRRPVVQKATQNCCNCRGQ